MMKIFAVKLCSYLQKHSCLVCVHIDDCFVALLCIVVDILSAVITFQE